MLKKTVDISIKPLKIFFIALIAVAVVGLIYFAKSKSKNINTNDTGGKEVVLPLQTGVADSGFEGQVTNFVALNAKATIDTYGKIDGASSLKISFSDQPIASVKIPAYLDNISSGDFYRLGFWAKSGSQTEKQLGLRVAEKDKTQDLGKFTLNTDNASYFEFTFQAENDAEDLIFTSGDATAGNIWIDDVLIEKLNVSSDEDLKNLKPAVFGDTTWKNIDQSQDKKNGNSEDFLAAPNRKIGQIFQPTQPMLSGIALRITRTGTGGTGNYSIQLREFDQDTGVISNDSLASTFFNFGPDPETAAQIKEKEAATRNDFAQREQDIKTGIIPQDKNEDHYPDTFTQDQIDAAKAAKRAAKLENDIHDMKESFNQTQKYDIPLAAKLDSAKKYWVGIDNAGVTVDQNNYISVSTASAASDKEQVSAIGGFTSKIPGTWENADSLWFETFYPKHSEVNNAIIMSGAAITDQGSNNFIYRYAFAPNDSTSASGFSGRKIYDMLEGSYTSDIYGNYTLSNNGDYATYQFNTLHPIQKIIIRNAQYHQSLALEISMDKENWEEIFSDNPAANWQTVDPIVFTPKESGNVFYLRIKSAGDHSTPLGLNLEAELASN